MKASSLVKYEKNVLSTMFIFKRLIEFGWLIGCFGVYIGPSPGEREKEKRNDRRE